MIEDQKQFLRSNNVGAIRAGDRSAFTTALQGELDALYRFVSRELIQVGNDYYVRERQQRISVARAFGVTTIHAEITV